MSTSLCAFHKTVFISPLIFYDSFLSVCTQHFISVIVSRQPTCKCVCICSPHLTKQASKPFTNYNNLVVCKRVRCHVIRHPFVFMFVFVRGCTKRRRENSRRNSWLQPHKRRKCISENRKKKNSVQSANTLQMEKSVGHNEHSIGRNMFWVSFSTEKKKETCSINWLRARKKKSPKIFTLIAFFSDDK